MDADIRAATQADLPAIVAIANWAAEHTTASFATEPESVQAWRRTWRASRELHPWLVAVRDGRVMGFARSGPHKVRGAYAWTAELSIYLEAGAQGQGLGRRLYQTLIPMLEAQGYVTLVAGITAGHAASERLHASMGFTRCALFPRVGYKLGQWCDVGYWVRSLAEPAGPPAPVRPVAEVLSRK